MDFLRRRECTHPPVWNFDTPITKDTTLYAKWITYNYTVTFDSQDASTDANPTSKTVISPAIMIDGLPTAPGKTGYTFGGWFTEESGRGSEFPASTEVIGDITVYAKWTYMVTFDTQGGGVVNSQLVQENEKATRPTDPKMPDYLFAGWYTEDTFDTIWDFDTAITDDITVYAKWAITRSKLKEMIRDDEDVTEVDTSAITDMRFMFSGASSFNQDLSGWNVSSVTDMGYMFDGASALNQDLSGWDVSSVTSMGSMFMGAEAFNGDISSWDVGSATYMRGMFGNASSFDQDLSSWDVSNVTAHDNFTCTGCQMYGHDEFHPKWN